MRTLILAPHVDDELIGCFSIINKGVVPDVKYFFELSEERIAEALEFERSGAIKILNSESIDFSSYEEVLIPSIKDHHPDHKHVNRLYRRYATSFYSVDMIQGTPLSNDDLSTKRHLLNTYYKSQSPLWEHDNKYFLFESIHKYDYDRLYQLNIGDCFVIIPIDYKIEVQTFLEENVNRLHLDPESIFNSLLSIVEGTVILRSGHLTFRV